MTAGPPCGSFVFLNMSTSGRRWWRPLGHTSKEYVKAANERLAFTQLASAKICAFRITTRLVLLLLLGTVRLCVCSIEQPSSSMMLFFPYISYLAKLLKKLFQWEECRLPPASHFRAFWPLSPMGAYGHAHRKPSLLFGSAPEPQFLKVSELPAVLRVVK